MNARAYFLVAVVVIAGATIAAAQNFPNFNFNRGRQNHVTCASVDCLPDQICEDETVFCCQGTGCNCPPTRPVCRPLPRRPNGGIERVLNRFNDFFGGNNNNNNNQQRRFPGNFFGGNNNNNQQRFPGNFFGGGGNNNNNNGGFFGNQRCGLFATCTFSQVCVQTQFGIGQCVNIF